MPRYVEFGTALTKTPTSKVRKTLLRDEGVTRRYSSFARVDQAERF